MEEGREAYSCKDVTSVEGEILIGEFISSFLKLGWRVGVQGSCSSKCHGEECRLWQTGKALRAKHWTQL